MPAGPSTVNELKKSFFSLKTNKSCGFNDINFDMVKCLGVW